MPGFQYFGPLPTTNQAYDVDSAGNQYFGEARSGSDLTRPRWSIVCTFYTTTAGQNGAWVTKFPLDPHGIATDAPMFVMAHATDGTYQYALLGTP